MGKFFAQQSLRGRSFRGQDLRGANFSGCDIRGADFRGADLTGANLRGAQTGLQRRWALVLALSSMGIAAAMGLALAYIGSGVGLLLAPEGGAMGIGILALVGAGILGVVTLGWGMRAGLGRITTALAIAGAVAGAVAGASAVASAQAGAGAGAGAGAVALIGAVAVTGAGALSGMGGLALTLTIAGLGAGALAGVSAGAMTDMGLGLGASTGAGTLAGGLAGLSIYVSWRAMAGEPQQDLLRRWAVALSCWGGTSFFGANLTQADLSGASLKRSDLRGATLNRVRWQGARKVDRARLEDTYLADPQIRQLLISRSGQGMVLDRRTLRHLDLRGVNLRRASLAETDLTGCDLRKAHLEGARLRHTQLAGADLRGAYLTGAVIEGWRITSTTQLGEIQCQFFYLHSGDPSSRLPADPQNRLAPGEFTAVITGSSATAEPSAPTVVELPPAAEPEESEYTSRLRDLRRVLEWDPDLNSEDKAEALLQVSLLERLGQDPENESLRQEGRRALKILRGTFATSPTSQRLGNRILDAVAQSVFLG